MNLLGALENGLFALGQVLRLPVITLLWVSIGFTLFYAGQTLVVMFRDRSQHLSFDVKRWINTATVLRATDDQKRALPPALRQFVDSVQAQHKEGSLRNGGLENVLSEHEEVGRRRLSGLRALVKIGPSLGLIGTLIPMGSSLAAMAGGDLQAMAGQMVVAFTTTIIGIAVGTVAFGLVAVRQSAFERTVREQRYIAEKTLAELENG
ncbi:MAG: MotA/TolQ/ExbB proton channel family protein [Pseudomonadota bacterium]